MRGARFLRTNGLGLGAGLVCLLAACADQADRDGEGDGEKRQPPMQLVGRVASVPAGGGFVLIQSYGAWTVPEGEPVFARGAGERMANLLPTGERMAQFVAADIRSGQVAVGDAVYFQPRIPAASGAAGDNPPAPAKASAPAEQADAAADQSAPAPAPQPPLPGPAAPPSRTAPEP